MFIKFLYNSSNIKNNVTYNLNNKRITHCLYKNSQYELHTQQKNTKEENNMLLYGNFYTCKKIQGLYRKNFSSFFALSMKIMVM